MGDSSAWNLNSAAIPQADRVERALEYAVLTWHRELALRDLLFQGRDALYYRSAAQVLGLVDAWGQPSELIAVFSGGEQDPLELLRECFEHSAVGLAWSRWAHAPLWTIDPDTAEGFLVETTELSEATRSRRAKTLRSWLITLRPEVVETAPSIAPPTARAPTSTPTVVERLGFDPEGFADVVQLWHAVVGSLSDEREQLIIRRRCGSLGTVDTLTEIGQALDLTRERVRQLETRALNRLRELPGWLAVIDRRLQALRGGASYLWLSQLEDESYFAPLTERPELLRYLTRRLLEPAWVAYAWNEDDLILTRAREREPMELLDELGAAASAHAWPAPWTEFVELVEARLRGTDADDLATLLVEQLRSQALVDDDERPTRVLGFGSSRAANIRAALANSPEPVAVADLHRRFGRGRIPSDCIYVRRGVVTLASHFEGFDRWQERLVPEVERIMASEDPGLQWMSADLFEALSERSRLAEWLTPMILASMLRRSGAFDDLGRQRFALKGTSPGERVQLVPTLVEILEGAGAPMPEAELFDALARKTTLLPSTAGLLRTTVPLFPLGDGRIGLIERDLPGGLPALREAEELLETELRARGRGLTMFQAFELVRDLSQAHRYWTELMVAVVPRVSVTLVCNRLAIGLESWDDCRVPSNRDLLRDLLDEGEGATTVERIQAAITKLHGQAVSRASIAGTAYMLGARLRGEWVLSRELDEPPVSVVEMARTRAAAESVELPSITELGIPRAGRQLFTRLSHESVGDWDALLERCSRHAAEFEARLATNEFLPVDEARKLLAVFRALVERVRDGASPLEQRLVWILGRYFEIPDDGELDFAIGGLDDDVQVFNAVTSYLGVDELEIEFS